MFLHFEWLYQDKKAFSITSYDKRFDYKLIYQILPSRPQADQNEVFHLSTLKS